MTDRSGPPLHLPTGSEVEKRVAHQKEIRYGAKDEARLLMGVGDKLAPEGYDYIASIAVHIYRPKTAKRFIDSGGTVREEQFTEIQQFTNMSGVPEQLARDSIMRLNTACAAKYGHKPPKRVGEKREEF